MRDRPKKSRKPQVALTRGSRTSALLKNGRRGAPVFGKRLRYDDAHGDALSEALLDNDPWQAGTRALNAADWPKTVGYTASCFMMLDVRDY